MHSSINLLYDVLDHINHIFSESLWYPLSTDPLPTHPSPTQTHHTHKTHQESTNMTIYPLDDIWHYTNRIFYETSCHPLSTDPLPTHPSPTQTHWRWWCTADFNVLVMVMHCRCWFTASGHALRQWCPAVGDARKVLMHWKWWSTADGDALQVVMHSRW